MTENFVGVIIDESLENKEVLRKIKILKTKVERVTEEHRTPWIKQWTLYTVEIGEDKADEIAKKISSSLDSKHAWYVDFKNDRYHYIIFYKKVFKCRKKEQYERAVKHGISLGIPDYQLDFSPHIKEWERK